MILQKRSILLVTTITTCQVKLKQNMFKGIEKPSWFFVLQIRGKYYSKSHFDRHIISFLKKKTGEQWGPNELN